MRERLNKWIGDVKGDTKNRFYFYSAGFVVISCVGAMVFHVASSGFV